MMIKWVVGLLAVCTLVVCTHVSAATVVKNDVLGVDPGIPVDVTVILDNSSSMRRYLPQIKAFLANLNDSLAAQGSDPKFSLVKFGSRERLLTGADPTDYVDFLDAMSLCRGRSGTPKRGSSALLLAENEIAYRQGSVHNIVLISNGKDQSRDAAFQNVLNALTDDPSTIFNYIGVPGGKGNVDARYGALAAAHNGLSFPLSDLNGDVTSFAQQFADTNALQIDTVIPEPLTLSMLVIGGLALIRRR